MTEVCYVFYVKISVDQEDKVRSRVCEEKTCKSDQSYEKICRRIVSKCTFLLLAVQPAVLGENMSQMYTNARAKTCKFIVDS